MGKVKEAMIDAAERANLLRNNEEVNAHTLLTNTIDWIDVQLQKQENLSQLEYDLVEAKNSLHRIRRYY